MHLIAATPCKCINVKTRKAFVLTDKILPINRHQFKRKFGFCRKFPSLLFRMRRNFFRFSFRWGVGLGFHYAKVEGYTADGTPRKAGIKIYAVDSFMSQMNNNKGGLWWTETIEMDSYQQFILSKYNKLNEWQKHPHKSGLNWFLLPLTWTRRIIDERKLQQRAENERQAYSGPHVDGFCVRYWRQWGIDTRRLRCHREQGSDAQRNSSRYGALIEPERDPRHDYQHAARRVDLDQVIRELSLE